MAKYRKRPVVIEAIQWTGNNAQKIKGFCGDSIYHVKSDPRIISISTLEGTMAASVGDYIIKGVNGEFYPCKPDIFAKTYEPVKEPDINRLTPRMKEAVVLLKQGDAEQRSVSGLYGLWWVRDPLYKKTLGRILDVTAKALVRRGIAEYYGTCEDGLRLKKEQ